MDEPFRQLPWGLEFLQLVILAVTINPKFDFFSFCMSQATHATFNKLLWTWVIVPFM